MKMFSDCSGPCSQCVIHFSGGCLAGHGDDDFQQVRASDAARLLRRGDLRPSAVAELAKMFPDVVKAYLQGEIDSCPHCAECPSCGTIKESLKKLC